MEGKRASGIVPEFRFEALPAVKPPDVPVVFWFPAVFGGPGRFEKLRDAYRNIARVAEL